MKLFKKIAAIILIMSLTFCQYGCKSNTETATTSSADLSQISSESTTTAVSTPELKTFDQFTNELFANIVSENTINLHSLIENPENYGIKDYKVTLGSFSLKDLTDSSETTDALNTLKTFDKAQLSAAQQVTYDQLSDYLETELKYSNLYLYWTQLTPTNGIQVSLPIIFAEYSFSKKEDIDNYIKLVAETDDYYKELIAYEKLRAQSGLFMEDAIADKVIDQCETFLASSDNSLLITTFIERLNSFDGLTEQEKTAYISANADAVNSHLYPAYSYLATELTALKGTNRYTGGICNYPGGKSYYEYLLRSDLGWSRSVDELDALLDKYINLAMLQMTAITAKDSKVMNGFSTFSFALTEPKAILADLEKKIQADFPAAVDVNYEIKYVDKSLEEYSSPAMYFIPQLDNYTENAIYINNSNTDVTSLYATLAHEGYPGHMYQTTYFNSLNPSPIKSIIRNDGFVEGWASYCELYSYNLADTTNRNLNSLMQANYQAILMLYSKVDLGINYYGWDKAKAAQYLAKYGITDSSAVQGIYEAMIAEPCTYPKYSLGCAAVMEFKNTAQTALGDKFKIKEFHRFLMELGPVQFDIVEKKLQEWINSQQ